MAIICGVLMHALTGCTVVHVHGAQSATLRGGVLRIVPRPGAELVSYSTEGFGVVPGPGGLTLGYAKASTALVYDPQACRIVILEPPSIPAAIDLWQGILAHRNDVCVTGGETAWKDIAGR
jgi:hypothetical protein